MPHLVRDRVVDCPFSVIMEYLEDEFARAERGERQAEARVPLASLVPGLGGVLRHAVAVEHETRPDPTETGRRHEELGLAWSANHPLLPDLQGAIRARPDGTRTRLAVDAEYVPPLGPLGGAFDALVGRRLAIATLDDLLARIAAVLEARERAFRASVR